MILENFSLKVVHNSIEYDIKIESKKNSVEQVKCLKFLWLVHLSQMKT